MFSNVDIGFSAIFLVLFARGSWCDCQQCKLSTRSSESISFDYGQRKRLCQKTEGRVVIDIAARHHLAKLEVF